MIQLKAETSSEGVVKRFPSHRLFDAPSGGPECVIEVGIIGSEWRLRYLDLRHTAAVTFYGQGTSLCNPKARRQPLHREDCDGASLRSLGCSP